MKMNYTNISGKKNFIAFGAALLMGAIIAVYITTHIFGFTQPYHQDEYKWAQIVNPAYGLQGSVPHPPLAEALYHLVGRTVGYNHLRVVPIIFGALILASVYFFLRRLYGQAAAVFSLGILAFNLYFLIATLQIDIDGALLPFFVLLTLGSYLVIRESWVGGGVSQRAWPWWLFLIIGLVGGFFTKLSFVLAPAAIIVDLSIDATRGRVIREFLQRRLRWILGAVFIVIVVAAYAGFGKWQFVRYVANFINFHNRDYLELFFLTVKAFLYASPALVGAVLLGLKYLKQLKLWYIFIFLNIIFYLVLFDFTHRTLDRYWMFFIVPAGIIGGVVLRNIWARIETGRLRAAAQIFIVAALIALIGHIIFSAPKAVIPLQPKTGFIAAATSGAWAFLIPFTGGSGPLGFYLPADGVAFFWLASALGFILLAASRTDLRVRRAGFIIFFAAALVYNIFGMSEYLFGAWYGSAPKVFRAVVGEVVANSTIKEVVTYNDTAGHELGEAKKYLRRFYTHEMFRESNLRKFAAYRGYYMVVNIPALNIGGLYARYFARCRTAFTSRDKYIDGFIYDCRDTPFVAPE